MIFSVNLQPIILLYAIIIATAKVRVGSSQKVLIFCFDSGRPKSPSKFEIQAELRSEDGWLLVKIPLSPQKVCSSF